jgi:hypothetical protein
VTAGLHNILPAVVLEELNRVSDDGLVSIDNFKEALRIVLLNSGSELPSSTEECLSYLEVLFLAMDTTEEGYADLHVLVCAMAVLCRG